MSTTFTANGIHHLIDWTWRASFGFAKQVAESAQDSGCTDVRPTEGARRQRAWDLVRLGLALNAISEDQVLVEAFEDFTVSGFMPTAHLDRLLSDSDWMVRHTGEEFLRATSLWESLDLKRRPIFRAIEAHLEDLDRRVQALRAERENLAALQASWF